ncbi:MAG: CDP-alcohol phosphatidyltransferase family protein [gamma proteobacterium symbiont of Bathyaustriella thionipta]|nr:CDP-alcohol phosphatidyltransferase family protein [gamma proteobacterium symbiont of Bathyaustriella thionipta]
MKTRDIPNLISFFRIVLTVPIIWAMLQQRYDLTLGLFFVAGVSDGLDGFLAKHYGWQSRMGALLDPIADKALLVSCYLVLGWQGVMPLWLVVAVILRDVLIFFGALLYHYKVEYLEADPTLLSKLNTVLQIMLVVFLLWHLGVLALPQWLLNSLIFAVALSTLFSGAQYIWIWGRRAIQHKSGQKHG